MTSRRIRARRRVLFGHAEAEQTLLEAYRGGRIPHAWLIGGESGIGKATLAYRLARFVLANPDPKQPAVQKATSLAVPPDHPSARRIAGQAHSDLLVLERVVNEKTGKLFTETRVEQVRASVSFFGSTAGEGGWRVAIVDPIEDLNKYGINALLKVLEEPPQRALLLLITDAPGRVLPTIRSRCRTLILRPLAAEDVARAAAAALGETNDHRRNPNRRRGVGRLGRACAEAARRRCARTAPADGRRARAPARARSARAARAGRRDRRHRGRDARGIHGYRQRLARRASEERPAGGREGLPGSPKSGPA